MRPEELMIGDWVYNHRRWECSIVEIHKDSAVVVARHYEEEEVKLSDLYPIPLTPEILEKNGMNPFDIDKLTDKATAKWWHKGGDFFIKQYHFKHHNFKPEYSFGCNNHTLIEGIEYVHELQHALKLCRIEKTIEP